VALLVDAAANPWVEAFLALLNVIQTVALAYLASERVHSHRDDAHPTRGAQRL